jgi:hypothetical protein
MMPHELEIDGRLQFDLLARIWASDLCALSPEDRERAIHQHLMDAYDRGVDDAEAKAADRRDFTLDLKD